MIHETYITTIYPYFYQKGTSRFCCEVPFIGVPLPVGERSPKGGSRHNQRIAIIIPVSSEYHQHRKSTQKGESTMYTTAKLIKVEDNQTITRDAYVDFFYELQRGVLLSLKEEGKLTEVQYRNAEDALKEQRIVIIRARIEGGSGS